MKQNIPSPKEVFGSIPMPLREAPPLQQDLGSRIMHVARVVIENTAMDGAILFAQRNNGLWHLPGGKVDEGQSCLEAGKAEIEQETGLSVAVDESSGRIFEMRLLGEEGPHEHRGKLKVSTVFTANSHIGSAVPLDETKAVAWQTPGELSQLGTVRPDTYLALATTGHLRTR